MYECDECGKMVTIRSKGKCGICRAKELDIEKRNKQIDPENPQVKQYPLTVEQVFKTRPRKNTDPKLVEFFETNLQKLILHPYSELSGDYIANPSKFNICHILPKRKSGGFPSIASDLRNCIFLTTSEHTTYDRLLDSCEFDELTSFFGNKADVFWSKIKRSLSLATERNTLRRKLEAYLN